jgi:hypothetical protein
MLVVKVQEAGKVKVSKVLDPIILYFKQKQQPRVHYLWLFFLGRDTALSVAISAARKLQRIFTPIAHAGIELNFKIIFKTQIASPP